MASPCPPRQLELPLLAPPPAHALGARRRIVLGTRVVDYTLVRGHRRSIGLSIDHRGLRAGAPARAALGEVEAFIRDNAAWVLRKLDEWRAEAPRHLALVDGTGLPLLGGEARLRLRAGRGAARWLDAHTLEVAAEPWGGLSRRVAAALKRRALALFAQRLALYAPQFGLPVPALALSAAQTRWGSCSASTGVRMNWRLIHLPLALIDYVAVHELAHLIEMNHSPRFWALVERLCPDWRAARVELRAAATRLPQI